MIIPLLFLMSSFPSESSDRSSLCYHTPHPCITAENPTFCLFISPNNSVKNTTVTRDCYYTINATKGSSQTAYKSCQYTNCLSDWYREHHRERRILLTRVLLHGGAKALGNHFLSLPHKSSIWGRGCENTTLAEKY